MLENVNNFLTEIIDEDIKNGLSERIHTRFPPEPNGYLHIGSAKAIFINWSIAKKYNGLFNLRYDDTNPVKEDTEYVDSIWEDIKWLTGEEPSGGVYYGSDYFETCFNCAVQLIKDGKAYVDDLTQEEMRQYRGSLTEPGKPSPYRDRSVEENLQLFQDMRDGKFADGSKTLRAKIDMASPNMNLRDPAIYRIVRAHHHLRCCGFLNGYGGVQRQVLKVCFTVAVGIFAFGLNFSSIGIGNLESTALQRCTVLIGFQHFKSCFFLEGGSTERQLIAGQLDRRLNQNDRLNTRAVGRCNIDIVTVNIHAG